MKPAPSMPGPAGPFGGETPEPEMGNAFQTPMWFIALLGVALYWGSMER